LQKDAVLKGRGYTGRGKRGNNKRIPRKTSVSGFYETAASVKDLLVVFAFVFSLVALLFTQWDFKGESLG
jgi:hypothetical protein